MQPTNAQLASLTGYTNLDLIAVDPEALELRSRLIRQKIEMLRIDTPLRIKVAHDLYRDRCDALLEAPAA